MASPLHDPDGSRRREEADNSGPAQNRLLTSAATALEMIDVTVGSLKDPELVVLEGVNWSVAVGDYWAVGGLNASGKSDFMAMAAGIMRPLRGTYRVFGQEPAARFENEMLKERLRIGLVFDGGQLFHHLTIVENVALPLSYHLNCALEDVAGQVTALLELTGLTNLANANPGTISRNRQQRAGLARALALKPEVLLLDNPLSGLDPIDVAWWLDLLDQLSAGHPIADGRPMTLVVTGDDLRPWKERAKQFALLKEKSFVTLGDRPALSSNTEPMLRELLPTVTMRQ